MQQLGSGLDEAERHAEALAVKEAELSTMLRIGASAQNILIAQGNLASAYHTNKRYELALAMQRDVYHGTLRLLGEEHSETLREANNYAISLLRQNRFQEGPMWLSTKLVMRSIT